MNWIFQTLFLFTKNKQTFKMETWRLRFMVILALVILISGDFLGYGGGHERKMHMAKQSPTMRNSQPVIFLDDEGEWANWMLHLFTLNLPWIKAVCVCLWKTLHRVNRTAFRRDIACGLHWNFKFNRNRSLVRLKRTLGRHHVTCGYRYDKRVKVVFIVYNVRILM